MLDRVLVCRASARSFSEAVAMVGQSASKAIAFRRESTCPISVRLTFSDPAFEALRNDIPFAGILAAGRRLGVLYGRETALQLGDQIIVRAARKHLGNIGAAGSEHPAGEFEARLDQCHRAQMVGLRMSDSV